MHVCIQDPAQNATYLITDADLERYAADPSAEHDGVDIIFVVPSDALVQELPAIRLSDSSEPTIQIVDPDGNRSWLVPSEALEGHRVAVPPSEGHVAWFAMPTARDLVAAVPVFRRALVQHSS